MVPIDSEFHPLSNHGGENDFSEVTYHATSRTI